MVKYCCSTVASTDCLYKLLVLYKTLKHHHNSFLLFVLCVDEECYRILKELKNDRMRLIRLRDVEDTRLLTAKGNRSFLEYCWTLKPVALYNAIESCTDAKYYIHLDADLCFFDSMDCIFEEVPHASVYLTLHNHSSEYKDYSSIHGCFNAGFVAFANDAEGTAAVKWWMEKCIEWCYSEPDIKRRLYGDQRYLDVMAESISKVHRIENAGVNAAHWNIKQYVITIKDGKVCLDGEKLIFYHFSGFYIISPGEYNLSWLTEIEQPVVESIYRPYAVLIYEAIKQIRKLHPGFNKGFVYWHPSTCKCYFNISN